MIILLSYTYLLPPLKLREYPSNRPIKTAKWSNFRALPSFRYPSSLAHSRMCISASFKYYIKVFDITIWHNKEKQKAVQVKDVDFPGWVHTAIRAPSLLWQNLVWCHSTFFELRARKLPVISHDVCKGSVECAQWPWQFGWVCCFYTMYMRIYCLNVVWACWRSKEPELWQQKFINQSTKWPQSKSKKCSILKSPHMISETPVEL